jgi:hypothetical protein
VRWTVRWQTVLGEEMRIAGGDDPLTGEAAGFSMIRVQAVSLPRVVAEHDIGSKFPDHLRDG